MAPADSASCAKASSVTAPSADPSFAPASAAAGECTPSGSCARDSPIEGRAWTAPQDYTSVHARVRQLKIGPYEYLARTSVLGFV
ncbi:MAG TPA: hypothetical protein P5114_11155, partial [Hyphomicrobiaceae bacterium]|nr:hypothetical protein [Hyphomicrobiaceae bacterium]